MHSTCSSFLHPLLVYCDQLLSQKKIFTVWLDKDESVYSLVNTFHQKIFTISTHHWYELKIDDICLFPVSHRAILIPLRRKFVYSQVQMFAENKHVFLFYPKFSGLHRISTSVCSKMSQNTINGRVILRVFLTP